MATKLLQIFVLLTLSNYISSTEKPCNDGYVCAPLSRCQLHSDEALFPCHNGLSYVCCPTNVSVTFISNRVETRKKDLFPDECGFVENADRISGGEKAYLGEFPWMALLGYRQKAVKHVQFLCGGSLITDRYVLTAAHCIHLGQNFELVLVRLGELDLTTEIDCIELGQNVSDCGDKYVDIAIERTVVHEDFNSHSFKNDIALVRMKFPVRFTEYIKPICLPFERNFDMRNFVNQNFTVSGWGKTNSVALGGSQELLYTIVSVWDQDECNNKVPPEVQPIENNQICASGRKKEDACKGDSGGPLFNLTKDTDNELRHFQVGLVSFSSTLVCGNPTLPTIYTRVDKYLEWIVNTVS